MEDYFQVVLNEEDPTMLFQRIEEAEPELGMRLDSGSHPQELQALEDAQMVLLHIEKEKLKFNSPG
jgi:hypothetical protein